MIRLKDCTKLFGQSVALDSVSLEFSGVGLVLILGSNGAGKSSLLRACAGLLSPSKGEISITSSVSYFGHSGLLYPQLTVHENLSLFAKLSNRDLKTDLPEWLELEGLLPKYVSDLSQGQKARVGLARALVASDDAVLLLDEPTAAFDQRWQRLFLENLKNITTKRLVLVVTHDPAHYLEFATRTLLIQHGRVIGDYTNEQKSLISETYQEILR